MASSPASSDLSDALSVESDGDERLSTAVPSSRPSVDIAQADQDHLAAPPAKRRKTSNSHPLPVIDRASSVPAAPEDNDDTISLSSDGFSTAPASPTHDEYTLRDEAQTQCLWRDCDFGGATNNDELVKHVQGTHCATGGPKKAKYVCEWGECQRKTSNHPSGYALKAHMRSHTKEKPYYCALPECDKSFTRSDALAKHMRTVHEPEPARPGANDPTPPGKKPVKLKLTNGGASSTTTNGSQPHVSPSTQQQPPPPSHDEDGNPVTPSPANDNITYIPAHHPITGQPGFMITYPPDINFSAWESSIPADQLMRLLRRQLHWAQQEGDELRKECEDLERKRKEEFKLKDILLEGVMEQGLEWGLQNGMLKEGEDVSRVMEQDVKVAKAREWKGGPPGFRLRGRAGKNITVKDEDVEMAEVVTTPVPLRARESVTPSPPPTGHSAGGGFDGDADPYDNYLAGRMAEYEERERLRSLQSTPQKGAAVNQAEKEAEVAGALVGLSGR